jgi:hypothetical protein
VLLVPIAVAIALSCGSVRDDELQCEEAVSKLENCCPGFDIGRVRCEYSSCDDSRNPDIDVNGAECIRATSCASLMTSGKCANLTRLSQDVYPSPSDIEKEACR